jgi:outer membrane lipoprotein-sorting protein
MRKDVRIITTLLVAGISFLTFLTPLSFALTGREIMEKVDSQPVPKGSEGKLIMRLISRKGGVRERTLQSYFKTEDGLERRYVKFLEPADVAGTSFLTLEQREGSDLQYLYLPVLHKVRRIAAKGKKGSFMGSDFTYKDMEAINIDEWKYKLLEEEEYEGRSCYVIEAKPASERTLEETGYSKKISWIDSRDFLARRVEFYDEMGNLLKILTLEDYRWLAEKYWIAHKMRMKNIQTGHITELVFEEMKVDVETPDIYFTPRYLMRGE